MHLHEHISVYTVYHCMDIQIHICIYIFISIHMYSWIYIYPPTRALTHTHTHTKYRRQAPFLQPRCVLCACVRVCARVRARVMCVVCCVGVCVFARARVRVFVSLCSCVCKYACACTCACTCACACACLCACACESVCESPKFRDNGPNNAILIGSFLCSLYTGYHKTSLHFHPWNPGQGIKPPIPVSLSWYWVATMSGRLKMIGLFCKRAL